MIYSGVYLLLNMANNKCYIGSSINLEKRQIQHINSLRKNKHENKYLQNAYNKYGEQNFMFIILENCDVGKLIEREQFWIDGFDSTNKIIGYNFLPSAGSNAGIKWSTEYKLNMSAVKKGEIKSKDWLDNIKVAILKSTKNFPNKRNKEKWPHTKRCKCQDCAKLRTLVRKSYREASARMGG